MINPSEIPLFTGNCDVIEVSAKKFLSSGTGIAGAAEGIHATVQDLAVSYQAPETPQLLDSTLPVRDLGLELGEHVRVVGAILNAFAAEMRPVAADLKDLKAEAQDFVDENGCDPDQAWLEDEAKVEKNNQMIDDVSAKVELMWEVERKYANAIEALFGGTKFVASDSFLGMFAKLGVVPGVEVYGLESIPEVQEGVELPWGSVAEYDAPLYEDLWNMQVSYMKGIWVDGVLGTIDGITTLIPIQPIIHSITGWEWANSWGDSGDAWTNLIPVAAVWGSGVGIIGVVANAFGLLPEDAGKFVDVANENGLGMLKGIVAWDTWSEDPARATGASVFNIGSFFIPGPKGLGGAKAGGLADDVARFADDAAKVDDFLPKTTTTVVDDIAKNVDGLAGYGKTASQLSTYGKSLDDILTQSKSVDDILAKSKSTDDILAQSKSVDDVLATGKSTDEVLGTGKSTDDILDYGKSVDEILLKKQLAPDEIPPPRTEADGPPMPTKDMEPEFVEWDKNLGVEYFGPAKLEHHRLVVHNGRLYESNGRLFDTAGSRTNWGGEAIYAMDKHGNLYASTKHIPGELNHSSFLGGRPVGGAGELKVRNGEVIYISRKSGHYKPSPEVLQRVVDALRDAGVRIDDDAVDVRGIR